jgi:hypothetical protein
MADNAAFTDIEPDLLSVFEDLRRCEPIFHTQEFGSALSDFERAMAPGYWEVGASGRRYSRSFILRILEQNPPVDAAAANWQIFDCGLRRLGPETYLFTYTLRQVDRLSRRATIWQSISGGWHILYHQGTLVSAEEDDVVAEVPV